MLLACDGESGRFLPIDEAEAIPVAQAQTVRMAAPEYAEPRQAAE